MNSSVVFCARIYVEPHTWAGLYVLGCSCILYMYTLFLLIYTYTYNYVGCLPRAFVPATPIGEQHVVDCSRAHPSLRGVMRWTCVSNLTWDGDLSGCAFTGSAVNSLVLVSYLICAGTSEVRLGLEMIQEHVCCTKHE